MRGRAAGQSRACRTSGGWVYEAGISNSSGRVGVLAIEHVHREVGGAGGHSERVVLLGQTNQETGRMDAGLTGEAHQTTAAIPLASVVTTNIG